MAAPTFVAEFRDGQITRMTTHCLPTNLDLGRGVRLAQHAYQSRMKQTPPAIIAARFETSRFETEGETLHEYSADDLWDATNRTPTAGAAA
jgi:hypothetical protein